ncbi:UDP-glucoronosyl and UDP-glucosyl transferase, partial [Trichostrongylus colubriformis]
MKSFAFCNFLLCLCSVSSYKIVFFVLDICNSQVLFNERVAETLAAAGHDVTMVLINPLGEKDENVKIASSVKVYHVKLSISITKKLMDAEQEEHVFQELAGKKLIERLLLQTTMFVDTCKATLEQKQFLRWLENEHFDLAFTHMFDVCTIGLVHNAKIPSWIWLNRSLLLAFCVMDVYFSGSVMDYVAQLTGIPIIPSYVPPMMMEMAGEMKFFERVKSMIGHGLMKLLWRRLVADPETAVFRQMIRPDFPDLLDLAAKCPLVSRILEME